VSGGQAEGLDFQWYFWASFGVFLVLCYHRVCFCVAFFGKKEFLESLFEPYTCCTFFLSVVDGCI